MSDHAVFQCYNTCYLEVINFQEIPLRCFYVFLQSHFICKMYQWWTLREFPVYYFLSIYARSAFTHFSLLQQCVFSPLSSIFTWIIFLPSFDERRMSIWRQKDADSAQFDFYANHAQVNRKLLIGPTKNVVFTISLSDIFFFLDRRKVWLRKEARGMRWTLRGARLMWRRLNKMNRHFAQNRKS